MSEVMRIFMKDEIEAERKDAAMERSIETALKMIVRGKMTVDEIAEDTGLPLSKIQELQSGISA